MELSQSYWFVGASWDNEDQTPRFVAEGIWENGYDDKYSDVVNSVKPGDLIAIKAAYTRKSGVGFNTRGHTVSTMAIKVTGKVVKNHKDGKRLDVAWQTPFSEPKEWYFYTHMRTIWHLRPGEWMTDALIAFTFENKPQDIDKFRNAPFWRDRFGDIAEEDIRFKWTAFYEALASALLAYQNDRQPLVAFANQLAEKYQLSYLQGKDLDDIDPFTFIGIFNRNQTVDNRRAIANDIAVFLGVKESAPTTFEAIPLLNNQKSLFFWGKETGRGEHDIDNLWQLFNAALLLADDSPDKGIETFIGTYDKVTNHKGIRWNITMGLFWCRPWFFPTLETQSMEYLGSLSCKPDCTGPKRTCTGDEYLTLRSNLLIRFSEDTFPVHSFPELSLMAFSRDNKVMPKRSNAWKTVVLERIRDLCLRKQSADFTRKEFQDNYLAELAEMFPDNNTPDMSIDRTTQGLRDDGILEFVSAGQYRWLEYDEDLLDNEISEPLLTKQAETYDISNIQREGCFIDVATLESMLRTLRDKKNLILQGAPGTGKTWLAKRLALALIGEKLPERIKAVQFHPNMSYEDFIRGWRPSENGQLTLTDGPFLDWINLALKYPANKYVLVIEEINRGNPAQIFGEMLTLLEADKRTPEEALQLTYSREAELVHIPANLYVIGTMNIADRSLALVDLAFRRRFAFINLVPLYGDVWFDWVRSNKAINDGILHVIRQQMVRLNNAIAEDSSLGEQFQIGHSFFTPAKGQDIKDAKQWYLQTIQSEIAPLLLEYWYDSPQTAKEHIAVLMGAV
ncbi:AAA family ATPase [Rheinheimera baltica]|uniref:AAA family ATPase n=1 Tax=Rheinheimera baltica TaxID=67576 RepID=A0ABT9I4G0_9GAMM|nr:AAA family ATPase [Rheinheimera baltica]MDP5138294.1 AAA family ATPase [Rheinheimera baltica]